MAAGSAVVRQRELKVRDVNRGNRLSNSPMTPAASPSKALGSSCGALPSCTRQFRPIRSRSKASFFWTSPRSNSASASFIIPLHRSESEIWKRLTNAHYTDTRGCTKVRRWGDRNWYCARDSNLALKSRVEGRKFIGHAGENGNAHRPAEIIPIAVATDTKGAAKKSRSAARKSGDKSPHSKLPNCRGNGLRGNGVAGSVPVEIVSERHALQMAAPLGGNHRRAIRSTVSIPRSRTMRSKAHRAAISSGKDRSLVEVTSSSSNSAWPGT